MESDVIFAHAEGGIHEDAEYSLGFVPEATWSSGRFMMQPILNEEKHKEKIREWLVDTEKPLTGGNNGSLAVVANDLQDGQPWNYVMKAQKVNIEEEQIDAMCDFYFLALLNRRIPGKVPRLFGGWVAAGIWPLPSKLPSHPSKNPSFVELTILFRGKKATFKVSEKCTLEEAGLWARSALSQQFPDLKRMACRLTLNGDPWHPIPKSASVKLSDGNEFGLATHLTFILVPLPDVVYMVMERFDGDLGSLANKCGSYKKEHVRQMFQLGFDVGLQGVVCGDLKPDQFLIRKDKVVLTDFGFAGAPDTPFTPRLGWPQTSKTHGCPNLPANPHTYEEMINNCADCLSDEMKEKVNGASLANLLQLDLYLSLTQAKIKGYGSWASVPELRQYRPLMLCSKWDADSGIDDKSGFALPLAEIVGVKALSRRRQKKKSVTYRRKQKRPRRKT